KEDLRAAGQAWTEDFSPRAVRGIGVAETLGAAGLVVPLATGIATILTPVAACGLVTVMIGAVAVHRRRHERFIAPAALGATAVVSAGLGFAIVLG
ncbi:MAG: DoxX family protein, partial [Actinomycetes bacterium]|nr:DoxX family protein [Actinomycetes bacterium]